MDKLEKAGYETLGFEHLKKSYGYITVAVKRYSDRYFSIDVEGIGLPIAGYIEIYKREIEEKDVLDYVRTKCEARIKNTQSVLECLNP